MFKMHYSAVTSADNENGNTIRTKINNTHTHTNKDHLSYLKIL